MYKKFVSVMLIVLMVAVSGPLEVLAVAGTGETPVNNEQIEGNSLKGEEEPLIEGGEVTVPDGPVAPTNLVAIWNGNNVDLTWTGDANTDYEVWYDEFEKIDVGSATNYTFVEMTNATRIFWVGVKGSEDSAMKLSYTLNSIIPSAVTGLKAESGLEKITVTWEAVSGADGYEIEIDDFITKVEADTLQYVYEVPSVHKKYTIKVRATQGEEKSKDASITGEAIRTACYKITFKKARTLYSHTGGNVRKTFSKGYVATATGFTQGKYIFWYEGRMYHVKKISTKNAKVAAYRKTPYTATEAENFVNQNNLSSDKTYLIWASTYTQHEYIFTGEQGNWKLKYCWQVSTGKASTPTAIGATSIKGKSKKHHGLSYWSLCSVYSFHAKAKKWKLGSPASGGCVRNTFDRAKWIYNNCAKKTRVYAY